MSYYEPTTPTENVTRGTLFSLVALPVGVTIWVVVWSFGFIASIISFGVAWLALFLYMRGSGGIISRAGAVRVTVITLGTVAISIVAGLVADVAIGIGTALDVSPLEALQLPEFGEVFSLYLSESGGQLTFSIAIAVVFGILGCFSLLRNAFKQQAATVDPGVATQPGVVAPQQPAATWNAPAAPAVGTAPATPTFGTAPVTPSYGTPPVTPTYGTAPATPSFGTAPITPTFGDTPTVPPAAPQGEQPPRA